MTSHEYNKVMVVDDNPANLRLLKEILQRIGYNVSMFRSAIDAIESLKCFLPNIILMDVTMPDLSGYEACRMIKAEKKYEPIPIIFISALSDVGDKVKAFENGGVDYITKPFEFEEVKERIAIHLKISKLQSEITDLNASLEKRVEDQLREIDQTNSKLVHAQNATIIALAKLAECRDTDTGLHLERVGQFCETLAKNVIKNNDYSEVGSEFSNIIKLVAPLHDIGKVGIEDRILLKPSKLSNEEFEIMKTHTTIGANTFLEVKKEMQDVAFGEIAYDIILCHHERYDGSGYPHKLKGEQIPLSARIMALADVYDALRSKRPYKQPMTQKQVEDIILEGNGKHFSPEVVAAFFDCRNEFDEIFNEFMDA